MLKAKVIETIKKFNLINNEDKVVVGVSGGPDSICLVNILYDIQKEMNFDIVVAHVNHMIREEANDDEEFVRNYCIERGLNFETKSIDIINISKLKKIGTEEARKRREI